MRKEDGSFAEYIIVKSHLQIHTPDNITDEEAATLGIAVTTIVRSTGTPQPRSRGVCLPN